MNKQDIHQMIQKEMTKLVKGLILILISSILFELLIVRLVGVNKFIKFFGLSVSGFFGLLAFVIVWMYIYKNDFKKLKYLIKNDGKLK